MNRIEHLSADSHNDTAYCGADQLMGGKPIHEIDQVTCLECLKTLVAYGLAARDRLAQLNSHCDPK